MTNEEVLEGLIRIKNDIVNLIEAMEHLEEMGEQVTILDEGLRKAVLEVLGKEEGEIFSREVQNIEDLDVRNKRVENLKGLEHFVNLKVLNLNWNKITDIKPLKGLTSLRTLKLWGNQITDITPLSRLTRLEVLTLEDNQVTNIDALKGLNNLNMLWLRKNRIRDLKPLLENQGLKSGSKVFLNGDLFTFDSQSEVGQVIEQLMSRGVIIYT